MVKPGPVSRHRVGRAKVATGRKRVEPNPNGNREERREAERQGITVLAPAGGDAGQSVEDLSDCPEVGPISLDDIAAAADSAVAAAIADQDGLRAARAAEVGRLARVGVVESYVSRMQGGPFLDPDAVAEITGPIPSGQDRFAGMAAASGDSPCDSGEAHEAHEHYGSPPVLRQNCPGCTCHPPYPDAACPSHGVLTLLLRGLVDTGEGNQVQA